LQLTPCAEPTPHANAKPNPTATVFIAFSRFRSAAHRTRQKDSPPPRRPELEA